RGEGGGAGSRASAAVNLATIGSGRPQCGQVQSDREISRSGLLMTGCDSAVAASSGSTRGATSHGAGGPRTRSAGGARSLAAGRQKEPPQKLIQRQPHQPLLVVVCRVAHSP